MKKALSVLLAMLVVISMCSVFAFADADSVDPTPITIKFVNDGHVIAEVMVKEGAILTPDTPDNPKKESTETTKYIFEGWQAQDEEGNILSDELYQKSTIPSPYLAEGETTKTICYVAVYIEKDITGNQSLLQFISSIFERLNMIFEYFAKIFGF